MEGVQSMAEDTFSLSDVQIAPDVYQKIRLLKSSLSVILLKPQQWGISQMPVYITVSFLRDTSYKYNIGIENLPKLQWILYFQLINCQSSMLSFTIVCLVRFTPKSCETVQKPRGVLEHHLKETSLGYVWNIW